MKINLIVPSFYPAIIYGGPTFSTLHTSQELARLKGMQIWVTTTNANMNTKLNVKINKWKKFENNFFVKYYNTSIIHTISIPMYYMMWKDIKSADVIHVQSVYNISTPVSLLYAFIFKKPVLLSPRGQLGDWCLKNGSSFKQLWLDFLIKPFKKLITWHATAEQEKSEITILFPNAKVEIVSNGIEYELFQSSAILSKSKYMKQYINKNIDVEKIIVSMGRLQKKKGFDILIDSFVKVIEQYPESKLLIAGQDEGEEKNLIKQIAKLGFKDSVFLIGAVSGQGKIDFLANADLFVLPSHNENFGNVYVESLAAGTPIVASTGTPWQEVEEADCGKWVSNSVEETSNAMLEMLKKNREEMRTNAKKLAKKYDWKNIALQFKDIFKRMIRK